MDDTTNVDTQIGDILSRNYMLAKLTVRVWSGMKKDNKATDELLASKGASAGAASVVIKLLAGNDKELKETQSAYTRIRTFFYTNSSPWTANDNHAKKGDRLIATTNSINFLSEFARLKKEAETARADFLNVYDQKIQDAALSLHGLYDASMYPTKQQIASLFDADLQLNPIPDFADFDRLTNVPADLTKGLKELYERETKQKMDVAMSDVQNRLMAELERMDTQFSKVAKGEKTRLFQSLIGNMRSLVGMVRSMNFVNNPAIDDIANEIEEHLLKHEIDAYRNNAALAASGASQARNVLNKVKDNSLWTVFGDADDVEETSLSSLAEDDEEDVPQEEPAPEVQEPDEDAEFLSSLLNEEEDDDTNEVSGSEDETDSDTEVPDFNPDDVMFS